MTCVAKIEQTNVCAIPSQLYAQLEKVGGWQNYIKQKEGGYATRMVMKWRLHWYLCLIEDLCDVSKRL